MWHDEEGDSSELCLQQTFSMKCEGHEPVTCAYTPYLLNESHGLRQCYVCILDVLTFYAIFENNNFECWKSGCRKDTQQLSEKNLISAIVDFLFSFYITFTHKTDVELEPICFCTPSCEPHHLHSYISQQVLGSKSLGIGTEAQGFCCLCFTNRSLVFSTFSMIYHVAYMAQSRNPLQIKTKLFMVKTENYAIERVNDIYCTHYFIILGTSNHSTCMTKIPGK